VSSIVGIRIPDTFKYETFSVPIFKCIQKPDFFVRKTNLDCFIQKIFFLWPFSMYKTFQLWGPFQNRTKCPVFNCFTASLDRFMQKIIILFWHGIAKQTFENRTYTGPVLQGWTVFYNIFINRIFFYTKWSSFFKADRYYKFVQFFELFGYQMHGSRQNRPFKYRTCPVFRSPLYLDMSGFQMPWLF
jgi:hypothetical protein